MSERKVDEALMDRIIAAVDEAGVSRAAVEGEWPECHKPRCQGHHGSPDVAMSYMKHQIIEAVKLELRYEATTRPDVSRTGDTPEQTAAFTLGVLLHQYRPDVTGTYAKAAQLIVDAYPGIIPALSGVVSEEPEWEYGIKCPPMDVAWLGTRESVEATLARWADSGAPLSEGQGVFRRIKQGPWVPVCQEPRVAIETLGVTDHNPEEGSTNG